MDDDYDLLVDARGHRCPLPTLRLARVLRRVQAGTRVRLLSDDPLARIDVPHFLADRRDRLIACENTAEVSVFTIESAGSDRTGSDRDGPDGA